METLKFYAISLYYSIFYSSSVNYKTENSNDFIVEAHKFGIKFTTETKKLKLAEILIEAENHIKDLDLNYWEQKWNPTSKRNLIRTKKENLLGKKKEEWKLSEEEETWL